MDLPPRRWAKPKRSGSAAPPDSTIFASEDPSQHIQLRAPGGSRQTSALVRPVSPNEIVHCVVRVDRLTGVAPKTLQHVVRHRAFVDVVVIYVGDLQLAAARRYQGGDDIEHIGVVAVDPRN